MPTASLIEPKCHVPQARGRNSYSGGGRRGVCYTGRSGLPTPPEDAAESCTDPGHESPHSIQGGNRVGSRPVAQIRDQSLKDSQPLSLLLQGMDKECLPQTSPEPQGNSAAQKNPEKNETGSLTPRGTQVHTCPVKKFHVPSHECLSTVQISKPRTQLPNFPVLLCSLPDPEGSSSKRG